MMTTAVSSMYMCSIWWRRQYSIAYFKYSGPNSLWAHRKQVTVFTAGHHGNHRKISSRPARWVLQRCVWKDGNKLSKYSHALILNSKNILLRMLGAHKLIITRCVFKYGPRAQAVRRAAKRLSAVTSEYVTLLRCGHNELGPEYLK